MMIQNFALALVAVGLLAIPAFIIMQYINEVKKRQGNRQKTKDPHLKWLKLK